MQQVLLPENMIPGRLYLMISREDPDDRRTGTYVDSYDREAEPGVRILHLQDTVSHGHIYYAMRDHEFYLIPGEAAGGGAVAAGGGGVAAGGGGAVVIGGGGAVVIGGGGAFNAGIPTLPIIEGAPYVGHIDIRRDLQDFADLEFFEEGEPVVRITDPSQYIFICKKESLNSFWRSPVYGKYIHPVTRAIMGQTAQTELSEGFKLEKGIARLVDPSAKEGGGGAVSILSGKKRSQRRTRRKRRSSRRRNRRNNQHGI